MELFFQLLINGVYVGAVYALYGLSFALIFAPTKVWHFAQGGIYVLAGYALYSFNVILALPLWAALVLAIALTSAAGAGCERLLYRPLVNRGVSHMVVVMASLGLFVVIENSMDLVFGPSGLSLRIDPQTPWLVSGVVIMPIQIIAPMVALAITGLLALMLYRTMAGREFRAAITNPELLEINGISVSRIKLYAFAIGSAILPVAALLLISGGSGVSPTVGITAVLTGAMAMFLGGVDSPLGAAVAGFIIGIVENLSVFVLPTAWQVSITYGILLLVIMIRPTGLFGRAVQKATV